MSTSTSPNPMSHRSIGCAQPTPITGRQDASQSVRMGNGKRADKAQRPSYLGASSATLEIVPENGENGVFSRRSVSYNALDMKGKARQDIRRTESMETLRRRRTDWVLDIVETSRGAKTWADSERVILVTGSLSAESLAPILYNPTFENTLLLVGTVEPIPSIEALTSPSFLLRNSNGQAIFPTLQPFNLSNCPNESHPLPAIIQQAASYAAAYRKNVQAGRPRVLSRRNSGESGVSLSPPRTPPPSNPSSLGHDEVRIRRLSDSSGSDSATPSISESTRPAMGKRASELSTRMPSRPRLNSSSRDSFFGSFGKSKTERPWAGGSPIDAVINFVPPAENSQSQRAMQDMLHQAVVLTTGVIPILARRQAKASQVDATPVTIMHVLPNQVPGPLPGVLENFLLGLLPKFAPQSDRELWSAVVTGPAWVASPRQVGNEVFSGSEVLLFGGLRCGNSTDPDVRGRAFLSNWNSCMASPGSFAKRERASPGPAQSHTRPLHLTEVSRARSDDRRSMLASPTTTPELDSSISSSSCSSNSGAGPISRAGSFEAVPIAVSTEKKKGLGWFKLRSKKSASLVR